MLKINLFILILLGLQISVAFSQQENADIRQGNKAYQSEDYQEAELNYRKALEDNPQNIKALYNLANALYKQQRYDEAANLLEGLVNNEVSGDRKADIYHNLGNANIGAQQLEEGIEAYKNALRLRPDDNDTRHNLAYALQQLQQQQQQQQQDEQDEDQQQDQQQRQPGEQDQEQEQQQTPRPDQISPQDAERILDALKQQEQEVQQKIDREEKKRQPVRPERQW